MSVFAIPRRGEVWMAALGPTIGHEIRKTRPVIIVTDDDYNRHNWVVVAVPITSGSNPRGDQVQLSPPEGGLGNPSIALPDQIRAIERSRLVRKLGTLAPSRLLQIGDAIKAVLDLS